MFKLQNRIDNYTKFKKQFGEYYFITSTNVSLVRDTLSSLDVFNLFTKYNYQCIKDGLLDKKIKITSSVKFKSKNADVQLAKIIDKGTRTKDTRTKDTRTKDTSTLAIKRVHIDSDSLSYFKGKIDANLVNSSESDAFNEIFFMQLTTKLLLNKITNNLPFLYNYYICDDCKFTNKNVIKNLNTFSKNNCIYIVTEKANGNLNEYTKKPTTTKKMMLSAFLQIFIGLYVIKKFFKIEHQDLHNDNVLFFNVKPGGYWEYIIGKKTILVPNYGALFVLWDFGFSIIPKLVFNTSNLELYNDRIKKNLADGTKIKFEDYSRVIQGLSSYTPKFRGIHILLIDIIEKSENYLDIIENLYYIIEKIGCINKDKCKILDTFNTNKRIKL